MPSGGVRIGAGRKPSRGVKKESLTVRITPELRKFLDSQDWSAAEILEENTRKTRCFRDWLAGQ